MRIWEECADDFLEDVIETDGSPVFGCDRSPFFGSTIMIASWTCSASVLHSQYAITASAIVARASGERALRASATICDSPGAFLLGSDVMTLMILSGVGVSNNDAWPFGRDGPLCGGIRNSTGASFELKCSWYAIRSAFSVSFVARSPQSLRMRMGRAFD